MNRFLTLALGAVAGAATILALQGSRADAESLTLYGDAPNLAEGRTSLTFAFLDPDTGRVIARHRAEADVKGGRYRARVDGDVPSDGLYTVQVSDGGGSQVASTFVNLQTTTPGTAQTGNVNITGTIRAGRAVVTGNLNPTLEVRSTSTATNANTAIFEANGGSARGLLAIARGTVGTAGLFQAKGDSGGFAVDALAEGADGIAVRGRALGSSGRPARFEGNSTLFFAVRVTSPYGGVYTSQSFSGGFGMLADVSGPNSAGIDGTVFGLPANSIGVRGSAAVGGGRVAVQAAGDMTATGTKSFVIDDPRDPTNRDIYHYCAEGPEPLMEYGGNLRLGSDGSAWVNLPDYWPLINRDPRYTLTPIGAPMPNLYVATEVQGNRFRIAGGAPNGKVTWRVTSVRNDRRMQIAPAPVEAMKPDSMRGYYRMPEAYGFGPERGVRGAQRATVAAREGAGAAIEP